MISVERTKKLLNDPDISDEEAEKIRDACRALAELIFDQWQFESLKKQNQLTNNQNEHE